VDSWTTNSPRSWTFASKLITGYAGGIGDFASSYAVDSGSGALLNGRISAYLRLIRTRGVGAGLVCRADQDWNFVAFYTAPEEVEAEVTFARFGVYREGILSPIAVGSEPIRLGSSYNHFSLEFFSGQLRGTIKTEENAYELEARCVEMPFPGYAGIVRLYDAALMATNVVVQQTTIPLTHETLAIAPQDDAFEFDVFLCHASEDKAIVRDIAAVFRSRGITYWLDEEQIRYGQGVADRIEEGLQKSRYVVPCVSANLTAKGWSKAEYNGVVNAELSGDTKRIVIPLVLDDSDAENVPLLLRDKRRAFYANKTEFEHFLRFLEQRRQ
jgi:hypothetical protein